MSELVRVEIIEQVVEIVEEVAGYEAIEIINETAEIVEELRQGPPGPQGPAGESGGDVPTPTLPIVDPQSSSDLAAGDSVNLDSTAIADGSAGKLQQITLSSSAPAKWVIKKSVSAVDTTLDVVFTSGNSGQTPSHEWEPPHQDYTEITGNGADIFFRVTATNLDARNAANVYVTFFINEIAE